MNVKPMNYTDVGFVKKLADESFGLNYITTEDISAYLTSKNNHAFCLFNKQKFIGFIFFKIFENPTIQDYFLIEKNWFNDYFKASKTLAVITQIALNKKDRKQGLSNLLFNYSIDYVKDKCDGVISICWIKDIENPMQFLLQNNGFYNIKTLKNYWLKDSIEKGYQCDICGNPCNCTAQVFELKKKPSQH